ncbi:hypothetical protein AVEN_72060-1 [Araneus ventricosus]|uniref:Uncharacterized protein n=1 Tax=Araneus ventricosus TaxID=182803 RepID=A0A4Y2PMY2_ARAVE|nr:hypothetical protein AVEN_72060-1 [Araneus ventricosus]
MSIDEHNPAAATLTNLEICQAACEQDRAIEVDDYDGDECVEGNPPYLDIRSTNFKKQHDYKQYITELLRNNCRQATINEFLIVIFELNYR